MTDRKTTGYAWFVRWASIPLLVGICFSTPSAFAEAGILQTLGDTVESVLPDHASPAAVISPGRILTFGSKKYAIFGTDPCPLDTKDTSGKPDSECVNIVPGMNKPVTLVPVDNNVPLRDRVAIVRTGRATVMELTSLTYSDGRQENFTPPLMARAG